MANKSLSPTARLLQHSRLFSLPPPLPRPSHGSATLLSPQSHTATLPYPTTAALETTQSALSWGDWGLKRPLPQQSTTNTTTPTIRVSAVDSIDHITDFDSAADHALTLRKWQEMAIPITMPYVNQRATKINAFVQMPSVFEDRFHSTQPRPEGIFGNSSRWKYKGPWLAGKTEGDFQAYVEKEIKRRRPEFRVHLRTWLMNRRAAAERRTAMAEGREPKLVLSEISEKEFQDEIVRLRQESTELWAIIWEFLDLPSKPPNVDVHQSDDFMRVNRTPEIEQGPPQTHPSAGLSYLRTASHTPNHPVLGPVSSEPPVHSRILRSVFVGGRREGKVLFGVGGIVTGENQGHSVYTFRSSQGYDEDPGYSAFEPDIEGGAKTWVHPNQASIEPDGNIKLFADRATKDTVAVWEGQADKRYTLTDDKKGNNRRAPSDFTSYFSKPFSSEEGQNKSSPGARSPYASDMPEGSHEELIELVNRAGGIPPSI